jgi:hypothetical protein
MIVFLISVLLNLLTTAYLVQPDGSVGSRDLPERGDLKKIPVIGGPNPGFGERIGSSRRTAGTFRT